jgi:hypothetical protein
VVTQKVISKNIDAYVQIQEAIQEYGTHGASGVGIGIRGKEVRQWDRFLRRLKALLLC